MHYQITERSSKYEPKYPNEIRKYRIAAGLSQQQLGVSLGRSSKAVSCWERGLTFPSRGIVLRLAKRLNTLVESLYYDLYAADQFFEDDGEEAA